MKEYNTIFNFRTSNKVKNKLKKAAIKEELNMSQFIISRINQKYKDIKEFEKFYEVYETIYDISDILSDIILDKNSQPYDEFINDTILKSFYNIKHMADNKDFTIPVFETKYNGSKKTHISLRLDDSTEKKLDYIANFYDCKKLSIMPLLLPDSKHITSDSVFPEYICYLMDIKNYFYEKHIDAPKFEKEYGLLWKMLL